MDELIPPEEKVARLVHILRTANVRDQLYKEAEQALIEMGAAARPILVTLKSDPDKVVRERASELIERLDQ